MGLSKVEFDILTYCEKHNNIDFVFDNINKELNIINLKTEIDKLNNKNFLKNFKITKKGIEMLEPYRVKKAIFIAAGFGSRLIPITLNTPKPLIRVNGKRMIDTVLDAVYEAGIEDITIVRGYLKEQFDQLLYKYPNLKFIDNDIYDSTNNISSAMLVRDMLENAYIIEGDFVLYNPKIITKYQYNSNYFGIFIDKTDDWCLKMNGNYIDSMVLGGENSYLMYGLSYWTKEDGKKLSEHIEKTFSMSDGKQRYWDEVALDVFKDEYKITVRCGKKGDIIEIDSLEELKQLDEMYNI